MDGPGPVGTPDTPTTTATGLVSAHTPPDTDGWPVDRPVGPTGDTGGHSPSRTRDSTHPSTPVPRGPVDSDPLDRPGEHREEGECQRPVWNHPFHPPEGGTPEGGSREESEPETR